MRGQDDAKVEAYRAGQLAKKLRAPLMVAVAVAVVALLSKVLT